MHGHITTKPRQVNTQLSRGIVANLESQNTPKRLAKKFFWLVVKPLSVGFQI